MAHANEVEEVSHEENSFSLGELELAYSHLLEKYSGLKYDNKDLKKKIETYVHDSTPCSKCNLLKKEIEKLNDKHTSLNSESEKLKSHASLVLEKNQKLNCDMSAILKENCDMKETIFRLIKGKQNLDQILSIPINFQKEGLGYTLNQRNAPKLRTLLALSRPPTVLRHCNLLLRLHPRLHLRTQEIL